MSSKQSSQGDSSSMVEIDGAITGEGSQTASSSGPRLGRLALWAIFAVMLFVPVAMAVVHGDMYLDVEYERIRSAPPEELEKYDLPAFSDSSRERQLLTEGINVAGMPELADYSTIDTAFVKGPGRISVEGSIGMRQPFTPLGSIAKPLVCDIDLDGSGSFTADMQWAKVSGTYELLTGEEARSALTSRGFGDGAVNELAFRCRAKTRWSSASVGYLNLKVNSFEGAGTREAGWYTDWDWAALSSVGDEETFVMFFPPDEVQKANDGGFASFPLFATEWNSTGWYEVN